MAHVEWNNKFINVSIYADNDVKFLKSRKFKMGLKRCIILISFVNNFIKRDFSEHDAAI